jgi:site-specific DNA-methyltransferase (adenine-specific)
MTLEIDRIYCGDCLDLMREMPDKGVDLVLTDPPYGIGITDKRTVGGGNKAFGRPGIFSAKDYGVSDRGIRFASTNLPSLRCAESVRTKSSSGVTTMPIISIPTSCWLVWDKDNGENDFADCELAWTSFKTAVRKFK